MERVYIHIITYTYETDDTADATPYTHYTINTTYIVRFDLIPFEQRFSESFLIFSFLWPLGRGWDTTLGGVSGLLFGKILYTYRNNSIRA